MGGPFFLYKTLPFTWSASVLAGMSKFLATALILPPRSTAAMVAAIWASLHCPTLRLPNLDAGWPVPELCCPCPTSERTGLLGRLGAPSRAPGSTSTDRSSHITSSRILALVRIWCCTCEKALPRMRMSTCSPGLLLCLPHRWVACPTSPPLPNDLVSTSYEVLYVFVTSPRAAGILKGSKWTLRPVMRCTLCRPCGLSDCQGNPPQRSCCPPSRRPCMA